VYIIHTPQEKNERIRDARFPAVTEALLYSEYLYCVRGRRSYCTPSILNTQALNAEFVKRALEKVGNPNVLVNLISRRVRQLNSGGGGISRPLVGDPGNLGRMGWELPELVESPRPEIKKRKKR
jgi:hypothetical protein